MYYRNMLSAVIALCLTHPTHASQSNAPPLVLAEQFHNQIDLTGYWISEKYDGARAWWDGTRLLSRSGYTFHAPKWFTANLPKEVLDGELWIGRNRFQQLMNVIRDHEPDNTAWQDVKFMVFDAPQVSGYFSVRQQHIRDVLADIPDPWIQQVKQQRLGSHKSLQNLLSDITAEGAEGLMLQREELPYLAGRHNGLLKLKTYSDAEAKVLAHYTGKGKYKEVLGSLLVEDNNGVQFRIGTGFSDSEREAPPAIGSIITFRYQGKTNSGKPRFARFLRLRATNVKSLD